MKKLALIILTLILATIPLACTPKESEPPTSDPEEWHVSPRLNSLGLEGDLALSGRPEYSTIEGGIGVFSQPKTIKWTGEDYYLSYTTALGDTADLATVLREGRVVWQYRCTSEIENPFNIIDVTLRPNNVIIMMHDYGVYVIDYEGNCIYGLPIDGLTHQARLLSNGNLLLIRSGYDQVFEITKGGIVVWNWDAPHQIKDYGPETYENWKTWKGVQNFHNPYATHREGSPDNPTVWTHVNSAQKLEDGYLLCLRNLDIIVKVDSNNKVVWSFGAMILKHPHCARLLENGNILVVDNGNGRIVEFSPNGETVFEYGGLNNPALGWCQKLWNGNYLFPDNMGKRILEVTPEGEIVKEIHTSDVIYQAKAYKLGTLEGLE